MPEDHLRAGGFLEQSKTRYRAAHQTNHIPQSQQPSVTLRKIRDEALEASSQRDAKTCKECAQQAVDYARWRDFCELRALTGNY